MLTKSPQVKQLMALQKECEQLLGAVKSAHMTLKRVRGFSHPSASAVLLVNFADSVVDLGSKRVCNCVYVKNRMCMPGTFATIQLTVRHKVQDIASRRRKRNMLGTVSSGVSKRLVQNANRPARDSQR